jgi:hypothetical protein
MNNIDLIRQAIENAKDAPVSKGLSNFIQDMKAEIMAEELVVEHGLLEATQRDVEDEVSELASSEDKAEEDNDFDNDENLYDMDLVSPSMRSIFED